eukprot:3055428-Rhodomonas_salina.7
MFPTEPRFGHKVILLTSLGARTRFTIAAKLDSAPTCRSAAIDAACSTSTPAAAPPAYNEMRSSELRKLIFS